MYADECITQAPSQEETFASQINYQLSEMRALVNRLEAFANRATGPIPEVGAGSNSLTQAVLNLPDFPSEIGQLNNRFHNAMARIQRIA